ncbi:MAG: type IV pilus twitching motility protein PilT [Planctomycetota bacterium]|nr:MAG: type IV pilus twitching motility protein PilT [Planctomycetota bacterium]
MEKLLQLMLDKGASDLHLTVGSPPVMRLHGRLRAVNASPLSAEDTTSLMRSLASERTQQQVAERGGADFGFNFGDKARFRVSVLRQRGRIGLVLRLIPNTFLSFEEIGLPEQIRSLCFRTRGLMLVTGPTGSGKTTTLATIVDLINSSVDRHILTIEDPIEYQHTHKRSIVTQREVGIDVESFGEALRRGLRQDPDVILVGEMRDLETISAAITAAETGHLVLATLHTTGAAETIHRIVDAYPTNQQQQVRAQLSSALMCVISQTLLPRADKDGRVAAFEVLVRTPAVGHLIRDNRIHQIDSEIQTGARFGMQLLDDHLLQLFMDRKITYQDMMERARDEATLQQRVRELGRNVAGGLESARSARYRKKS